MEGKQNLKLKNKENIITASITDDWLYKIPLNDDPPISNTMDSLITTYVGNYPKRLQPLQIISLNDSLVAISCSGFINDVNGQVQIWNIQSMKVVASYEFNDKSIPWHLIKSPVSNEIFIVFGGSGGNGGLAALTYTENEIEMKWKTLDDNYMNFHGVTIDSEGEYIYVTSRGNHYLYQFRNMVEPFLRDVQGRRGIFDFKVVCDATNNTGEVIDRNEFIGDIYIKPARSINFITLNFIAVRTGVSFSEVGG